MQIDQSFVLQSPLTPVWQAFHDVRLLVSCLPGASIDESAQPAADADEDPERQDVALLFRVKLGPIAAQFKGRGRLDHDEAAHTGSFTGSAVDGKTNSRIKGAAHFVVSSGAGPSDNTTTRVVVSIQFTITGALAQFSREGIVRALADQLSQQFAENLQRRMPQTELPATPNTAASAAGAPAAAATNAPLPTAGYAAPLPEAALATGPSPSLQSSTSARPDTAADSSLDLWRLFKSWLSSLLRNEGSSK